MQSAVPPAASPCPPADELGQFLRGETCARRGELERHLVGCAFCLEKARTLPITGPLVEAMRRGAVLPRDAFADGLVPGILRCLVDSGLSSASTGRPQERETVEQCGDQAVFPSATQGPLALKTRGSPDPKMYPFLVPPQQPGELGRLGNYRVLDELGSGGMGLVFKAEDVLLHRQVALKVIRPRLAADEKVRKWFMGEARAAAAIENEHVVAIHQVGEDGGVPFLAMPLLHGESLQSRLDREEKVPMTEVLRISRQIATGLGAAHAKGLIHRDIKPANVWLESEQGKVKVLDFGLARVAEPGAGMTGAWRNRGDARVHGPGTGAGRSGRYAERPFQPGRCPLASSVRVSCRFVARSARAVFHALGHAPAALHQRSATRRCPSPLSGLIVKLLAKGLGSDRNRRRR